MGAMRTLVLKLDNLLLAPPQVCSSVSVQHGMSLLKNDVHKMCTYLDQLSGLEDPPLTAKCWMNEARDLSYDMEDYIDSLLFVQPADPSLVANNIKTTRSLLKLFSPVKNPKRLQQPNKIAETVSEFRMYVQAAIQRHEVYVLSDSAPCSSSTLRGRFVSAGHILPTPYEETDDIVINGPMNKFINSLAKDGEKNLKVVSVFGSACLGKTTLARLLYDRFGKQYNCRAFIRVSKKADMKRIFRDMLSQLKRQHPRQDCEDIELIYYITEYLQHRRYLIVIDDIWDTTVWDNISHAFPKGSHGSRIITTTQIEDVALTCCCYQSEYVFEMKSMDDDQSRKLFFNRLFGSESSCPPQLKETSNEIVEMCGGLPLATISIASLLASQPVMSVDQLTYIRESLSPCISACSTSERTRQALNLSFNNLPDYLKTCLLYLSIYPEGYTFCKDDLVKQWVAEGLIDSMEMQDTEKVAENYLHQLIDRRFIQPVRTNYNNEVLSCAVHDTVHGLIAHKSAEQNFIVAIDNNEKNPALSHKARRLCLLSRYASYGKTPTNIMKSQVRSLRFVGLSDCMPCIQEFKLLRVLNLEITYNHGPSDPVDLTGMSELYQLKYLKIACDVSIKLPNHGLQCLETLDIKDAVDTYFGGGCILHLPHLLHASLPFKNSHMRSMGNMAKFGNARYVEDLRLTSYSRDYIDLEGLVEALGFLIGEYRNLRTVVVSHCSMVTNYVVCGDINYWDNMEPPPLLQRFEWSSPSGMFLDRIPRWFKELKHLSILKIAVRILETDCVDVLRGLHVLTALSLCVLKSPAYKIIFDKAGFSDLKYFKLKCISGIALLKFEADAMPNICKIKLVFNASPQMDQCKRGAAIIIIDHMPRLKEVSVKFGGTASDVEYAVRTFVNNHPSNPKISMQQVEYSSCDEENTKQKRQPDEIKEEERDASWKQQPDNIVEDEPDESYKQPPDKISEGKPDKYKKTLEIPADKRSPESLRAFTLGELISATSNFSQQNRLRKHNFDGSSTYKGTVDGKVMVTIKKFPRGEELPELENLWTTQHPHVVRLLGYCNEGGHAMLVYEYIPRGNLADNLIRSLPWLTRLKIAIGAAKGLAFLHESANCNIIGFNASSILLGSDYTAKIQGFYRRVYSEVGACSNVFDFGLVLVALLTGQPWAVWRGQRLRETLSRPHLSRKGIERRLHCMMDPRLEGQYSFSAAWSAVMIACRCMDSELVNRRKVRMSGVVGALEPLLSDHSIGGPVRVSGKRQSKKSNMLGCFAIVTRKDGGIKDEEDMKLTRQLAGEAIKEGGNTRFLEEESDEEFFDGYNYRNSWRVGQ
ncbi:hypothetical protein CFC21_055801 [Triticum aestivum]|uniref:Protein kinase domain-containing protein n=2 Tax=Triticum aestivum TaxID=4565 RepID=A0A9R1GGT5_WHEAT|nr:hypothetical protein CFC21_055801 [Triticum aestivum]